MADTKISELTPLGTLNGSEKLPGVRGTTPGAATPDTLKAHALSGLTLAAVADSAASGGRNAMTTAERDKLTGIAPGATANDNDANLKARANHTGEQAQSTVTGLVDALAAKAPLVSPTFTNTPAAPTASPGTNTTQLATTAFVAAAIAALINSAPGALDTLDEIAAALGDDPDFAATLTTALAGKQPLHAILSSLAGQTSAANKLPYFSAENTFSLGDFTSVARTLLAQSTQALMRTTGLGLSSDGSSLVAAANYAAMKTLLAYAIGDVSGLQAALDAKAPLASPALTGTPTAPTASGGTNTTQLATTAFVQAAVAALINSAPGVLDTLDELAAALGDDANFAATVTTALNGKQPIDSDLTAIAALTPADNDLMQRKSGAWVNRTPAQVKTDLAIEGAIVANFSGGGSAITSGFKGYVRAPYAMTINRNTVLADQTGSIVIDVWKVPYASFPPSDANSITASAPPTISSGVKSEDATLTGWTLSVAAGDILGFNVDSCSGITQATVILGGTRT